MTSRREATDLFYMLMDQLAASTGGTRRLDGPGLASSCPRAGMYFFFEDGELRPNGRARVVRIGTHGLTVTSRSTLWGRLRQHRGHLGGTHPGGGNHRGSIFRRHVGAAIIDQRTDYGLLESWMATTTQPGRREEERSVEVEVSRVIRSMPFLWLSVPTRPDGTSDRGLLERNVIGLLSTTSRGTEVASANWLGHHALAGKVRSSSLWNVNHVDDAFDAAALDVLESYVLRTPQRIDSPARSARRPRS